MPRPGMSKKHGSGLKQNPALASIAHGGPLRVSLMVSYEDFPEPGPSISLVIRQMGKAGTSTIHLSSLTEDELVSVKEVLDRAFEWALPVARARDAHAQEVFNEGGESFDRIYRSVPTLHHRQGISDEHREGVFNRPSDAADIREGGSDSPE